MASVSFTPVFSSLEEHPTFNSFPECELFIEVGQFHIGIMILDRVQNMIMATELIDLHGDANSALINDYLKLRDLKNAKFKAVNLIFNTKEFTLIPSIANNPLLYRQMLETIHGDMLDLQFNADQLEYFEAVNVYGVQREINACLHQYFPNINRIHKNSCFAKSVLPQLDHLQSQFIKVHFSPSHMDIIIVKSKKLQFLQKFYYETTDDTIFFLLSLSEKFKLNKSSVSLCASGILDLNSITFLELKKHFPVIEIETNDSISIAAQLNEIPSHFLTPLMMSLSCV